MNAATGVLVLVVLAIGCSKEHETAPTPTAAAPAPTADGGGRVGSDFVPEVVTFKSGAMTLTGFLYKPEGAGPFPAIVYNHGSEPFPGPKGDQASFYVPHGFVLFVPHRRGHGRSKDAGPPEPVGEGSDVIAGLVDQNDDVLGAIAYVAALPYVNAKRIAVAGCSYGGIETLLSAERATGIYAAIDFAGGAMRWDGDPALQERMKIAARNAKVPVMFVQAENDYSIGPSKTLAAEMQAANKPMLLKIYPPNGTTPREGHRFCMGDVNPPWGDDVLAFLHQN